MDHHAPLKSRHVKGMPTPWVSDKLLEVRRDRDFRRRKALSSNSQYHWGMYRKSGNFANREERSLKSRYYCKQIKDAKNESSSIWKAIKQTLPSNNMDTNAISLMEKSTLVLLILQSILIKISRTLEDILPRRSAIHRLRHRKMLLVLMTSNWIRYQKHLSIRD